MRPKLSFATVLLALLITNTLSMAQTPSPSALSDDARRQADEAAFADAERQLTIHQIDRAIAQTNANAAMLEQVKAAAKGISDRLNALETNDDGKRLAATLNELSARQVQQLMDEPPVLPEIVASEQKEIQSVLADLNKLRGDPPTAFVLPDRQQDEMARSSVSLRNMLARIRERDGWLTSLMSSAPRGLDVAKLPTLAAVLVDFRQRQQQAWNAAQQLGIDQAKPEALSQITESARTAELERSLQQTREMLARAHFEIEQSKIDLDMQLRVQRETKEREVALLNQKLAESEAHRSVVNAQADATRQEGKVDAEKIRLRQKCQDPEVTRLLAPFIAQGLWQPGDRVGQAWVHDRGPVSLSALKKFGVLQPTQKGLINLYVAGSGRSNALAWHEHPDTDRPKWGFPPATYKLSHDDWQELRHIQDLLNELGETMVELGMLAK